ncbi:MAG: hypothetical protein JRH06_09335 [Deltaproteobacteria bacterium]|nr:hypothetical protein [Deltaproteobacteria bacterium]MBW2137748.1 hypothetical protein [Deltaproteobacteria bacterium]
MVKGSRKRPHGSQLQLLGQLEELARSLNIVIRYENLKKEGPFTKGGLCKLKGEYLLIVDSKAPTSDQIQTLAESLVRFDLSKVYLKPGLREFLERMEPHG